MLKHKHLMFAAAATLAATLTSAFANPAPVKVLMVTGDWKIQEWYQDVWMKKKGEDPVLYRGRFIKREVDKAAPGKFEFTEVTNYIGQEYMDADWLSQFDVVLLGDIMGLSLNPRFLGAVGDYVKGGGGLIYCASHKWGSTTVKNTPFAEVLPAHFPVDAWTEDWRDGQKFPMTADTNFKPQVSKAQAQHAIVKGLDWASVPDLDVNFRVTPKEGAAVVLESPAGNPVLTAWELGRGRVISSSSIFANDQVSTKFGDWKDFGKYYANVFSWLGANSTAKKTELKDAKGKIGIGVDFATTSNKVTSKWFGLHGAHDCPGFSPLAGLALENYNVLNLGGALGRFDVDGSFQKADGTFDFTRTDRTMRQMEEHNLVPVALFNNYKDGRNNVWVDGASWTSPNDASIANIVRGINAFLDHTNGKKGAPEYKLRVPYIELFNEPDLNTRTIPAFAKIIAAVAKSVRANHPGVQIGAFGSYETPYMYQFIDECGGHIDWVARHPYGWTGEMVFKLQNDFMDYAKSKGHGHIKFMVNEWDFWIMGRQKFDYMIKRNFEAVKSESLIGTLHYRLGMYNEPIYLFGVLWAGWGQDRGAGTPNTPMHDAYDAFWIFKDFRGARAAVEKEDAGKFARHVHADAIVDGKKMNVVLYYDWAYGGEGYTDYESGTRYTKIGAEIKLDFPKELAGAKKMTISKATGEGFAVVKDNVAIPAGANYTMTLDLEPLTAYSLTIGN